MVSIMPDALLKRLEIAVRRLLEQNHQLRRQSNALQAEKVAWQEERAFLLETVEQALKRLENLKLEEL